MQISALRGRRPQPARRRLAWAVPVLVTGLIAGGVAVGTASSSSASPTLPHRSAAQLLTQAQTHAATAFSGEVHENAAFGLPSLPGGPSDASLSWQSFLSGAHTARVWSDGPGKQRVALLGQLSEADVIHNGRDLWTYTSSTDEVSHTVLPGRRETARASLPDAYSPAAVASHLLEAIRPSTAVHVDASRMVADRPAYTLVLRPRDARSTVRAVTIAIDAARFVPLQVQIFGSGSSPVFDLGFTDISFARPAASIFDFHRPAGAGNSTNPFLGSGSGRMEHHTVRPATRPSATAPNVIGSGWTTVLELHAGTLAKQGALPGGGNLAQLTSPIGNSGARLLHTALLNAVLMPDGRIFVAAMRPAPLEHLAATTPR